MKHTSRTRTTGRGRAGALALALVLLAVGPATADVQRFESVGAVPILLDQPDAIAPRDAAIDRAILDAVERVASQFLAEEAERQRLLASTRPPDALIDGVTLDDGPLGTDDSSAKPGEEPEEPDFEAILGKQVALYASRYRVLEDRGEGPTIFTSHPEATSEYVVIVEVFVDADRVRSRLVKAGAIPAGDGEVVSNSIRVEVDGLDAYPGYLALRSLLLEECGAISVIPVQMEVGRSLLEVESPDGPMILQQKLLAVMRPGLEIVPLVPQDADIRLGVEWTPLLPEIEGEGLQEGTDSSVSRTGDDPGYDGHDPDDRARATTRRVRGPAGD